ncbi:MAG TPA: serine/threonine-protein kinase [Kofleriaceae bacterium]|nr:serine/threonine-protein kinase [Kofleriaceae bacterium]
MAATDVCGSRLGNYELVRLLAQGGMADIYLARQHGLNRLCAVKVLNGQRARDAESCALFMDEARLAGLLTHANLASVYDVAAEDGVHYLAMEYVQGADLREILARCEQKQMAVTFESALTIVAGAASALDYAHRRCDADGRPLHLVHRDVSLSNIMVGHDGSVKVIDFGIAISTASMHHTNPGIVRGKASYMSPEQCLGDAVDLRTDVFALGIVLYELTTGRRCFSGNSDFERMLAVVQGEWTAPRDFIPEFPESLEQVIKTALALDPDHRYSSAAALIEALEAVAMLEGWTLGTAATVELMQSLYATQQQTWATAANDDETVVTPPPAPPTKIMTSPRRFARGTESDVYEPVVVVEVPEAANVPAANDWQDEAPTRGRRSMPRMWSALSLAA